MSTVDWLKLTENAPIETGLVGANVCALPFISGFGCLARITRLNWFRKSDLFAVFGVRATQGLDLLRRCEQPGVAQTTIETAIGMQGSGISRFWSPAAWSPIDVGTRWSEAPMPLRLCPSCARYGYHSTVFQMPWVERCPWHRDALISACPRCVRPFSSTLGPHEALLRCACGFDWFDRRQATIEIAKFPTTVAAHRLQAYLQWSAEQAAQRRLIAPTPSGEWLAGMTVLVRPPPSLGEFLRSPPTQRQAHVWRASEQPEDEAPPPGAFAGWMDIRKGHTIQLAKLPDALRKPLRNIARQTVLSCPPKALTHAEWAAFGVTLPADRCKPSQGQPEFVFLPAGRRIGHGTWIYLVAVIREAVELCDRVLEVSERELTDGRLDRALSPDTALSLAFDRVPSRGLVLRLLEHLLSRGYAAGLRIVLARHIPELYDRVKSSPASWLPIVEMRIVDRQVTEVRAAWIKRRNMDGDVPFSHRIRLRRRQSVQVRRRRAS
jgi:hypothetical protein